MTCEHYKKGEICGLQSGFYGFSPPQFLTKAKGKNICPELIRYHQDQLRKRFLQPDFPRSPKRLRLEILN